MEMVECPICSKEFPHSTIETHASKCLFLNETSQSNTTNALGSLKSPSPGGKRGKTKQNSVQERTKRKSVSQESFIENDREFSSNPHSFVTPNTDQNGEMKAKKRRTEHLPLAELMRPSELSDYVGQDHILGPKAVLFNLLNKAKIPNIILWGPPGCGKTSLANVIANICRKTNGKMRYVKLSASVAGVSAVKDVVTVAANDLKFGKRTVVFMDEIHRFNKSQQDVFLPHVEAGTITLIGATTENPSFSLNSALLSRCRVIVLEKLTTTNLISILEKAVTSSEGEIHDVEKQNSSSQSTSNIPKFIMNKELIEWLAETCDGDARIALSGLESVIQSKVQNEESFLKNGPAVITLDDIKENLKKAHMLYDRKGDQHYDIISALHKSVRASDENASLYWLARMIVSGEDPVYIARRLIRMASEDIGLEDPNALGVAVNTMHVCKMLGMPECDVALAQCTTYLARAPKSRLMEDALNAAKRVIAEHKGPQPSVPLHLRNAPTKLMKRLEYGRGYNMRHKDVSGLTYLPQGLEHLNFFGEDSI